MATSQLLTWSSRHTVNSSHTCLVTQSTRHNWAHNKATTMPCSSVWLFGFNVVVSQQRWLVTTSICGCGNLKETKRCTYMYNLASYCSECNIEVTDNNKDLECEYMRQMLGQRVRSTRPNAVRHDVQLVTPFYGATCWPCDELNGSQLYHFISWLLLHQSNPIQCVLTGVGSPLCLHRT